MALERTIVLTVEGDRDSDREDLAALTWDLREDLLTLDVADVDHPSAEAPSGAKGSAMEWAQLVVTLAGSAPPLFGVLRGWVGRHPGCSVTLSVGEDRLTLDDLSPDEQRRLYREWLERQGL